MTFQKSSHLKILTKFKIITCLYPLKFSTRNILFMPLGTDFDLAWLAIFTMTAFFIYSWMYVSGQER